jgi:hypothetical protein
MQIFMKKDTIIAVELNSTCSREVQVSLILKGLAAILNEGFCGFTQPSHENVAIML